MSLQALTHFRIRARIFASSEGPLRPAEAGREPASGRTTFPAEALKVRRRAPSSDRTRSRADLRRRGTALAGVCPSGRPPATTPASRCAQHPPGRGYGCARVAIDLPRKAVDREDVASCSLQPIQLSSSTLWCIRIPFREPPSVSRVCSPSSRRRLCPVPPRGARRAELITGRERPGTVAGPQDPSGAAVGPHLRPWLERSRFLRIGTASVETLPFATSVFFLPRSEGPRPRTPHFIVRRSARPELRRVSNAPRYSSLKLRAPSTAES